MITALAPAVINDTGEGAGAIADEDADGFAGNWSVRAYAICADPLPGLVQVSAFTPYGSTNPKSVSVSCPMGKNVLGTGFYLVGLPGIVVDDLVPNATLRSVFLTALKRGTPSNWSVTAHALCADPLPGLERVSAPGSTFFATPRNSRVASCPLPKKATGAGFELAQGGGYGVVSLKPIDSPPTQIEATAYDRPRQVSPLTITSHAICASP